MVSSSATPLRDFEPSDDLTDIAPLLRRECRDECPPSIDGRSVSLHLELRPVFLPSRYGRVLTLACRALLRETQARADLLDGRMNVGVHLWRAEFPAESVVCLQVASTPSIPRGNTLDDGSLMQTRDAVEALGGELTCEPGLVVLRRVTLPMPPIAALSHAAEPRPLRTGT